MKSKIFAIAMLAIVFTIAGCKKKDDTNNTNTNTASLIGTWNKPYSGAYITVKFKDATNYGFGFSYGTTYNESVYGIYTVDGNKVSITQTGGSGAGCPGVKGTYTYSIVADSVLFTVVDDPCSQNGTMRSEEFGTGTFKKQ